MKHLKIRKKICRICLKDNGSINWNNEVIEFFGVTYKECYFKYLKLEEAEPDCYPENLCDKCAYGVRNAHTLFEKALQSYIILQHAVKKKELENEDSDKEFIENSWEITEDCSFDENFSIENLKDDVSYNDDDFFDETIVEEISTKEIITIEGFKPSFDNPLQEHPIEITDIKTESSLDTISELTLSKRTRLKKSQGSTLTKKVKTNHSYVPEANPDEVATMSPEQENIQKVSETYEVEKPNKPTQNSSSEKVVTTNPPKRKRVKQLLCQYCSYKAVDFRRLREHEETHNENRERNVTCPKCNVKLLTKSVLTAHLETHKENRIKKHKCEFCEKAFFNKGALNVHRRIHLGLMYKCPICEKEFFRQLDLDRHLTKHSITPARNNLIKKKYGVECQYCKKIVLTNKLKDHMAAHLNKPQAKCLICHKDFFGRQRCTAHLRRFHKIEGDCQRFTHMYENSEGRSSFLKIQQEREVKDLTK